jgi:hypothetical protein
MLRRSSFIFLLALCLASCQSDGELAARMEAQDHAACAKMVSDREAINDPQAYTVCRHNLVAYRQINEQTRRRQADALETGLQGASRALCGIYPDDAAVVGCRP